jgi:hypothetical protein
MFGFHTLNQTGLKISGTMCTNVVARQLLRYQENAVALDRLQEINEAGAITALPEGGFRAQGAP